MRPKILSQTSWCSTVRNGDMLTYKNEIRRLTKFLKVPRNGDYQHPGQSRVTSDSFGIQPVSIPSGH